MEIGLTITAHCNASCLHCSTSCGPDRSESLKRKMLHRMMDEAAELGAGEPLTFSISGGEPFLDFELLLDVLRYGSRLGARMTCVSNASWAASAEAARDKVAAVKAAGLYALAISTSRFHQEFVSLRRVERALNACRDAGVDVTVKYVRTRSDSMDEASVRDWALAAGASGVQDFPLMPHLRSGAYLPFTEYPQGTAEPAGTCPASLIMIREDGRSYTCCTPGAFNEVLYLGSVPASGLRSIRKRFYTGGIQQILRRHGPSHLAQQVRARGQGQRLRESYTSVCDLCTHICSDPVMAGIAAESAEALEMSQLQDILKSALPGYAPESEAVQP